MYLEIPSEGRKTLKSASLAYTKPQVQSSQTGVMAPAGSGSTWQCRQEYQKFKVIFSHLGSWRPSWTTNTQKEALQILKQYTNIYICKHSPQSYYKVKRKGIKKHITIRSIHLDTTLWRKCTFPNLPDGFWYVNKGPEKTQYMQYVSYILRGCNFFWGTLQPKLTMHGEAS